LAALAALAAVAAGPTLARADAALAPHRAVYELKLRETRGSSGVDQVRGRIVYEFKGGPCDGYALNFRQVTEIDNGEGDTDVSDLRAETWEDAKAKSFRFAAKNYRNQELDSDTDGRAERLDGGVSVTRVKPTKDVSTFEARTLFPTEHLRKIIEAASRSERLLEAPIYDGSEKGDKTYDTLTVIGAPMEAGEAVPEAPAKTPELDREARWPVTISYFERGKKNEGEQAPDYVMSFDLYANGVSRALKIDYGKFILDGELKELEFLKPSSCR
jgi:hypothetical protein